MNSSIMEADKRKRCANFKNIEIDLIMINLIIEKKEIIENKKSDVVTWKEKQKCWQEIADALTAAFVVKRDAKMLKSKYEKLKKSIRKKSADIRQQQMGTGGGACVTDKLTPVEEKVKAMIVLTVEGLPSQFDSDTTLPQHVPLPSTSTSTVSVPLTEPEEVHEMLVVNTPKKNVIEENIDIDEEETWSTWTPTLLQKLTKNKGVHASYNDLMQKRMELTSTVLAQEKERHAKEMELLDIKLAIKKN